MFTAVLVLGWHSQHGIKDFSLGFKSSANYHLRSRDPCQGSKCCINLNMAAEKAISLFECINEYHPPFTRITFLRALCIINYALGAYAKGLNAV